MAGGAQAITVGTASSVPGAGTAQEANPNSKPVGNAHENAT